MTSWLGRQKKSELVALADRAGVSTDGLLKDDIVSALDTHLKANSSRLSSDKFFAEYYDRSGSPVKKARPSEDAKDDKAVAVKDKEPKRRKTVVKAEPSSPEGSSLVPRSPASLQRFAASVRLPSSPAINRAAAVPRAWVARQVATARKTPLAKKLPLWRQELSSVEAIHLLLLVFEAAGLSRATTPWSQSFSTPAVGAVGLPSYPVWVPDVTTVVSSQFWAPTSLWAATSVLLPALFAYVFNLTYHNPKTGRRISPQKEFDPMIFSIAKGLLAYLVYSPGASTSLYFFSKRTVATVQDSLYGGYATLLIGAAIGVLTSIADTLSYKS